MSEVLSQPGRSDRPPTGNFAEPSRLAVIGIGASAGGLEAATQLMQAWPVVSGMALILVQHLDPKGASMLATLLAPHTALSVCEAAEGMRLAPGKLYVIPPGTYLSASQGVLHLSAPTKRHGARMPFDFLLHSLAGEYGARAGCVVLSGTGTDVRTACAPSRRRAAWSRCRIRQRRATTACRAAPSAPAWPTPCCRWPASRVRWPPTASPPAR